MNQQLFDLILLCIPVMGFVLTGFVIPYLKTKVSAARMEEIIKWVTKTVEAAEVLFDTPQSGAEKREYVINFIDNMFNAKKEIITKDQIRILLESAWLQLNAVYGSV